MRIAAPELNGDLRDLDAGDWNSYFHGLTLGGESLSVQVSAGEHTHASRRRARAWLLQRIRYDSRTDEIHVEVAAEPGSERLLRFFVAEPRTISVRERERTRVITVRDSGGLVTVIHLAWRRRPGYERLAAAARAGHLQR